jgi:hypothetical protein
LARGEHEKALDKRQKTCNLKRKIKPPTRSLGGVHLCPNAANNCADLIAYGFEVRNLAEGTDSHLVHGHVYAVCGSLDRPDTPGFQLCLDTVAARGWTLAKRALSFAALTNDGDGALFLDHPPSKAEAATIRDCLGIAKKRAVSEVELARLRSMSATFSPLRPRPSLIEAKAA